MTILPLMALAISTSNATGNGNSPLPEIPVPGKPPVKEPPVKNPPPKPPEEMPPREDPPPRKPPMKDPPPSKDPPPLMRRGRSNLRHTPVSGMQIQSRIADMMSSDEALFVRYWTAPAFRISSTRL